MKNWSILLIAILLACFVWVLGALTQDYSAYFQYKVTVTSTMTGYGPSSTSNDILLIRGKSSGFYLLHAKDNATGPLELEITVDPKLLIPDDNNADTFRLSVDSVRDKIEESLSEHVSVHYFDTQWMTFKFTPQHYRKVPVAAVSNITCARQYMVADDIELYPDSVLIYGPVDIVDEINEINTRPIYADDLMEDKAGYTGIEKIHGIRVNEDHIHYTIKVDRYFEASKKIAVSVTNLPGDKQVMVIPSEMTVSYRVPFGLKNDREINTLSLVIDYHDILASKSQKLIPNLVADKDILVYSHSLKPEMVECIIVDGK